MTSLTIARTWEFSLGSRRQVVEFTQNTLSGKRVLVVNGVEQFRVNAQYKLTGCVNFVIDGVSASVVIEALDYGQMFYSLIIAGKPINTDAEESVLSSWLVRTPSNSYKVQFDHLKFDVFLNRLKVDTVGDFLEEGSKYSFTLPSGESAEIFVTPIKAKGHKINAKLVVDGTEVVEGMDDDDDAAAKGK